MWKNYILVALRNLSRYRLYSVINIVGLAIGLAGCLLIAGYVTNELSFEDCHEQRDRIFRVASIYRYGSTTVPFATSTAPLAPAMAAELPEIEDVTCFRLFKDTKIEVDHKPFDNNRLLFASPEILKVFTLPLQRGDGSTALNSPSTVLLSDELAARCFGDNDPVGRTLRIDSIDCRITGVLKPIPANTQLRCDAIVSFSTLERMGMNTKEWGDFGKYYVYASLKSGPVTTQLRDKISAIVTRNLSLKEAKLDILIQPLNNIYLHSSLNGELDPSGNLTYVYTFSSVAVLLLILASINFVNLATARTTRRIKEVAVRKVFGAGRANLIYQFIGESVCLTTVSMLLGVALFEIAKPQLETFIGRELPISLLSSPALILVMIVMVIVVGVIAGSYPAFFLSRYRPADAMRKDSSHTTSRSGLRRILVVIQFAAAIGLTITAIAIYRQSNLFRVTDMGFRHENMLILDLTDEKIAGKCRLLRDEIAKTNKVEAVSAVWAPPGAGWTALRAFANPSQPDQPPAMTPLMWVDEAFISTFGIKLIEGRGFSNQYPSDLENAIIVNKTAVKEFGLVNPVGQTLIDPDSKKALTIIGVVDDFHSGSLRNKITAGVLMLGPSQFLHIAVQLPSNDVKGAIGAVTDVWKKVIPDRPFQGRLLDDIIAENYESERKTGMLFIVFAVLSAFIGSLGIFGLASFAAERRTKEVGIRKVLGASVSSVVLMLTKEFVILVIIANVVTWPIAYYSIQNWLQEYAYRIELGFDIFIYAGLMALAIALLTVGYQAIRAATANPVESLKYE